MIRSAFYNEFDPFAADWLGNLVAAGTITRGIVDRRSIVDVQPEDVARFRRVHFFAGIGGWDYALDLAGWGDEPVWTGSCPCQPFSDAGKRKGTADERHLWPQMFRLIEECRPGVVFGEQVASAAGLGWLDGVFADLEGAGYACGAADLCAAGEGAPHIRQRLFWVADARHGEPGLFPRRRPPRRKSGRRSSLLDGIRRPGKRWRAGTRRERPTGARAVRDRRAGRCRRMLGQQPTRRLPRRETPSCQCSTRR